MSPSGALQRPIIAITQGDPASIGPEICLREVERWLRDPMGARYLPLLLIEPASLESVRKILPIAAEKLVFLDREDDPRIHCVKLAERGLVAALAPEDTGQGRQAVVFGEPGPADARGAMSAIDLALDLCLSGRADAMVTAPVNKAIIAEHVDPTFRGHTDTIASRCASNANKCPLSVPQYGRDYLMAFVGEGLNVALLSTHLPLLDAIRTITTESVVEALECLDRSLKVNGRQGRKIALAGLNPHAGEGGLLGSEDQEILVPAVAQARELEIDVTGPESADTLFLRARNGEFDWVLALYHDQGLIPVKTLGFGGAVNWTAGIHIIRTSVDHGTAYPLAGKGLADPSGLFGAVDFALRLARSKAT